MTLVDFGWLLLFAFVGTMGAVMARRLFGFWFSPLAVFVGMNCASMMAFHLRLLEFSEVSPLTHFLLLVALSCYTFGTLVALEGSPREKLNDQSPSFDATGLDTFFTITAILASIGWLLAVMILVGRHGLGALLGNIWVLQLEFQMQFIGYLNMIGILVLPTFVLKWSRGRVHFWDYALVGTALFGLLLAGIKAYLIYSMLTALFVWSTTRPDKFRPSYLIGGLLIMLAFFIVYTNKVDIFVSGKFESQTWLANFPSLQRPYVYLVGSWPALENIVNGTMPKPPMGGIVVLQPLWKLLGDGLGIIEPMPFNLPFSNIGTTFFNVYSLPGEIYWDFGWPGLIILTTSLGYLSTKLYLRVRRLDYWAHHLIYGIIGYGLFLSPFVYSYRFNVFVILGYIFAVAFVGLRGGTLIGRIKK
ncbi:MAG: O-antigen polymerase [Candidatus Krumholzibacteria bacterium]|nr:O-antigen polymerase [Candidatus Krumholzibacteria bacterium]